MTDLTDKIVVITGGTGGLGGFVVAEFLKAQAKVYVPWIHEPEYLRLKEKLAVFPNLACHFCDLAEEDQIIDFFEKISKQSIHIDAVLNLVGGFVYAPLTDTTLENWQKLFIMNCQSNFLVSKHAKPLLAKAKTPQIINVAAQPALNRGAANMSAYAASKAAVLNFTYSLADELKVDGIRVNAIVPTIIDTKTNRNAMPNACFKEWQSPQQIADTLIWLCNDKAQLISGSALNLM